MHANENNWAENPISKDEEQYDTRSTRQHLVCVQQHCIKLGAWQNTARHHHHCANGKFFSCIFKLFTYWEKLHSLTFSQRVKFFYCTICAILLTIFQESYKINTSNVCLIQHFSFFLHLLFNCLCMICRGTIWQSGATVAHKVHTLEVDGSNPSSAIIFKYKGTLKAKSRSEYDI